MTPEQVKEMIRDYLTENLTISADHFLTSDYRKAIEINLMLKGTIISTISVDVD